MNKRGKYNKANRVETKTMCFRVPATEKTVIMNKYKGRINSLFKDWLKTL